MIPYILSMLANVWSSFSTLNVAALGIFVSGVMVSLTKVFVCRQSFVQEKKTTCFK